MCRVLMSLVVVAVAASAVLGGGSPRGTEDTNGVDPAKGHLHRPEATRGCTVFFASDGTNVLAGNNEDFYNPSTRVWFLPAEEGKYGRLYFGFDDFVRQGGMNDQGLFFDTIAAPKLEMPHLADRERYAGDLITKAMEECATAEEAASLFRRLGPYSDPTEIPSIRGAILFGDRSGRSVIIEGDVQIPKKGAFQVMTNFYQSRPELGGYPCRRFEIVNQMLEGVDTYSVDLFRRALAATHLEHEVGVSNPTVYSNIYDLKRGIVSVYHFHNFENAVVLDLNEELSKGRHEYDLSSLFPSTVAAIAYESAFPPRVLRDTMQREGIPQAKTEFRRLMNAKRYCPPELINRLGYELMGEGKMAEALAVFRLYVETHADDWNAHDSLGEAYMNSGEADLAIQSYEKSMKLNPDNANGAKMLAKLRGTESVGRQAP